MKSDCTAPETTVPAGNVFDPINAFVPFRSGTFVLRTPSGRAWLPVTFAAVRFVSAEPFTAGKVPLHDGVPPEFVTSTELFAVVIADTAFAGELFRDGSTGHAGARWCACRGLDHASWQS